MNQPGLSSDIKMQLLGMHSDEPQNYAIGHGPGGHPMQLASMAMKLGSAIASSAMNVT